MTLLETTRSRRNLQK